MYRPKKTKLKASASAQKIWSKSKIREGCPNVPSDHNFNHVLKLIENDPLHTCDRRRVDVGSVFHHLSSCLVVFNQFRDL